MSKSEKYRQILQSFKDKIYRLCWTYADNDNDRKDLYQNILVKIWQKLDTFNGKSEMGTWVYRISVNTAIDAYRKKAARQGLLTGMNVQTLDIEDKSADIEADLLRKERLEIFYKCIDKLSFFERTFIICYLEEMSYEQISKILGISEKNASVKMFRIKNKLKKLTSEYDL
jgi:RNA polymerase sigma-70 factor (ECF subfamily)